MRRLLALGASNHTSLAPVRLCGLSVGRFPDADSELFRIIPAALIICDPAPLAGITQAYWSLIEAGKRSPSIGILKRMARALGVTVAELVR